MESMSFSDASSACPPHVLAYPTATATPSSSSSSSSLSYLESDELVSPRPRSGSHGSTVSKDPDNFPPYSRIFVMCHKSNTEEELERMFARFGDVEYVRLLRDRDSQTSKGLCYIKYAKTSSAACAIEAMDGIPLHDSLPPLKVQIADSKQQRSKVPRKQYGNDPEDMPPRSRLFVVCPRDLPDEVLEDTFAPYDPDYCKVMTDRHTGASKGYAYVKFHLASNAARAMEAITATGLIAGRKVKVLIADPKAKRQASDDEDASGSFGYYPVAPANGTLHDEYDEEVVVNDHNEFYVMPPPYRQHAHYPMPYVGDYATPYHVPFAMHEHAPPTAMLPYALYYPSPAFVPQYLPAASPTPTLYYALSRPLQRFVVEDIISRVGKIVRLMHDDANQTRGSVQLSSHEESLSLMKVDTVHLNGEILSVRFSLVPLHVPATNYEPLPPKSAPMPMPSSPARAKVDSLETCVSPK